MVFVLPALLLMPVMDSLLTGTDSENPHHQTFKQESGESPRRDMAEEFAEWGREK